MSHQVTLRVAARKKVNEFGDSSCPVIAANETPIRLESFCSHLREPSIKNKFEHMP